MQKLLIGLSGKMGTGKSTVAKLLKEITGAEVLSFAKPLYKLQDIIYKECDMQLQGDKDRDLLITLGEWGRSKDPEFWIQQFAREVLENNSDVIICDDVRFPQEADFFKKYGVLFRIEGEQRGANVSQHRKSHKTETALDTYEFEHVLNNTDTPEMMCQQIAKVVGDAK